MLERLVPDVRAIRMIAPHRMIQFLQPAACAEQVLHFLALWDGIVA
jgi:hypothetical protein